MRIAVTGGNGDLGRRLTPYLLEQGHAVISIDRGLPPALPIFPGDIRYLIADTTNFGEFVGSIRGCDAVIHLAAIRSPINNPDHVVYAVNTLSSYNALSAASALGIKRVCLASSINAIGGVFSRVPRYDYFPVDEKHPTYAEEAYGFSKWVLEQQGDMFARRFEWMTIASLRFHWLTESLAEVQQNSAAIGEATVARHLWAYTLYADANRACLASLTADFTGHEAFYITAPNTMRPEPSLELARAHYPHVPIRGDLSGHTSFFNCAKAERLLGWKHEE